MLRPSRTLPADGPVLDLLAPRVADVGMAVARLLPSARRRAIGPWVFVDHFGPVSTEAPIEVPPHPHTGLSTVTWLFEGSGFHRDSLGSAQALRVGEVAWMTAGHGIAHSEVMPAGRLHGVQLWVALPPDQRDRPPSFEHHADLPAFAVPGAEGTVFAGSLGGVTAPVTTHTPLVGADLRIEGEAVFPTDPTWEHGLLGVEGQVTVDGPVPSGHLAYLGVGRPWVRIRGSGRVILLGGPPYPEPLLLWWNFVVGDASALERARSDWDAHSPRFGPVAHPGPASRLEAPPLPR
ncbi:MAG: pirin family protein [Myxococcota bacterium]